MFGAWRKPFTDRVKSKAVLAWLYLFACLVGLLIVDSRTDVTGGSFMPLILAVAVTLALPFWPLFRKLR
ncbi:MULTISPECIES: hypothetical protein [unclassified Haladaptatus]|uniref:hypothetical protein n=1 Tax=unclassified Haladaptatus TaxID=2622732 RepID=UPI002FCDED7A